MLHWYFSLLLSTVPSTFARNHLSSFPLLPIALIISLYDIIIENNFCVIIFPDIIVLRHPAAGSADEAASAVRIPLINAGDGTGEHPTQVREAENGDDV